MLRGAGCEPARGASRALRTALAGALAVAATLLAPPARAATPSPSDWRDQSVYQILTDRFFDGNPANNASEGSYDPADGAKIHGGDWAGIEQKLDYIQALGATAIWISPVQKNAYAAYHGYHIQDFYTVAAHFGGMGALRSLVASAHARGMYVILDVIANHGGDLIDSADPDYPDFHDPGDYVLRWRNAGNKAAPPFNDLARYHNNGGIDAWIDPNQILGELFGLDDFRTEDAAVRQDLIAAHTWLIDTTDADGFRIDTVKHVELSFWQEFGPAIRAYAADSLGKGSFFQFGEIFDCSSAYAGKYTGTEGGGPFALDAVLWYPMYCAAKPVFRDGQPTSWLSGAYADSLDYDPSARGRLVAFLDNHDVDRFMAFGSNAERDEAKAKVALVWLHTSLGVPCVYYGTEQEFDGGGDPYNREDMWSGSWNFGPSDGDNFDMTAPLFAWIRRLNALRERLPALRRGSQEDAASEPEAGIYAYHRRLAGEATALVVLNTKPSADTLVVDPDLPAGTAYDGLSERTVAVPSSGSVSIVMGGHSAAVFSAVPNDEAPWVARTWPRHDGTLPSLSGTIRIAFTEEMDRASVAAALTTSPSFASTTRWVGPTLVIEPSVLLSNGTTYTVRVGSGARSAGGDSLGTAFAFHFRTSTASGPISVPAGWYAAALPGDDLRRPLALEAGAEGTRAAGRLLVGDSGWDRVLDHHDRGFVEARVIDTLLGRPTSLSLDLVAGAFGGDLLIADSTALLRASLLGATAERVVPVAALPAAGPSWIVAVDTAGAYGGLAYLGAPGRDSVYAVAPGGALTRFAGGLGGVTGLAFSPGGPFGSDLYAATASGTIYRISPAGAVSVFVSQPLLSGAAALAFDPVGAFGRDLFVARTTAQSIVRVTPAGAVSTFATGFSSLAGGDALAFDRMGDLYAAESGTPGTARLVKIVSVSSDTNVTPPAPTARFLLRQNAPNPFRPSLASETSIAFELPRAGATTLTIHDTAGALVRTLLSEPRGAGPHVVPWDGTDNEGRPVASGVYLYRLRSGRYEESRRLVVIR